MARPKSLIIPLKVDTAQRGHSCQHNSSHKIAKGDSRLKVSVGRSHEHYCVECASKFIDDAQKRLHTLKREIRGEKVGASPESELGTSG
jgi:hypothetical protein